MKRFVRLLSLVCAVSNCTEPSYGPVDSDGDAGSCVGSSCDASVPRDGKVGRVLDDAGRALPGTSDGSSDVGPGSDATTDAMTETEVELSLPAGTEKLPGRYAVRARFYATDVPDMSVNFLHNLVMIADIRPDVTGAQLEMEVRLCEDNWTIRPRASGIPDTLSRVVYPQKYPVRVYTMRYEQGRFYTSNGNLAVGYEPTAPSDCAGLSTSVSSEEQKQWQTSGTCNCSTAALPTDLNDCRVIDSDDDTRAAMTVALLTNLPTATTIYSAVRVHETSQLLNGMIDNDQRKHTAELRKEEDYLVFCGASSPPCQNSAYRYCAPQMHPVLFQPIDKHADGSEWTCEEVLAQRDAHNLFDDEPLAFPSGC